MGTLWLDPDPDWLMSLLDADRPSEQDEH